MVNEWLVRILECILVILLFLGQHTVKNLVSYVFTIIGM